MEFNDYAHFLDFVDTLPINDVVFGVKPTAEKDTLYISLQSTKNVGSDNFSMTVGYWLNLVISVEKVDSIAVKKLSVELQNGMTYQNWDEKTKLYVYSGLVYVPVGGDIDLWTK